MCDSVTGQCKCTPGFMGDICDQSKDLLLLYGIQLSGNKQNMSFVIIVVAIYHPFFGYNMPLSLIYKMLKKWIKRLSWKALFILAMWSLIGLYYYRRMQQLT